MARNSTTRSMYVTYTDLLSAGVNEDRIKDLTKKPLLGYETERHFKFDDIEVLGKTFSPLGKLLKEVNPQSALVGKIKAGDLLLEVNGAKFSHLNKEEIYIKDQTVYSSFSEFIKEGDEIPVTYLSPTRSSRSSSPMGMFNNEPQFDSSPITVTVTAKFLYKIIDREVIERIERNRILQLPKTLKKKLFNQDQAIDKVYKNLKVYFAGLKDKSKPIGSYLLVGPTGTGKTELAKLLAQLVDFSLVRIDMSEYGERHTVSRLIGSPPSYIGYGDKTILEKEIGNNGRKVVLLLDEMEKAHWDLQKIFLQAMDNSRITLANGTEVDFNNTLILMTSNLGTITKSSMGLGVSEKLLSVDMEQIKQYFLPEFLGRLSGVIQFNPLTEAQAQLILEKFIAEFNQNQMSAKNCSVKVSPSAREQLVKTGFNQLYGARPLKNALQGEIFEKIADLFLTGDSEGSSIMVDFNGTEYTAQFEAEDVAVHYAGAVGKKKKTSPGDDTSLTNKN
jgi:ATP-dependent Clp protease ATP-binding subunit ClpA